MFFKHGILAFRIAIVLYFVFFLSTCTYRPANYESRPGHGRLVTTDHASIITFLLCVLCILLLITDIEPNPGPGTDDSFSCSSFSSSFNDIVSHTVSFVHLSIQSIVPKLDLISAEFICHDILSFTESWLTPRVSDTDMIIPGYKPPFRRDRVERMGGGVLVYVRNNINCHLRPDLHVSNVECIWLELRFKTKKYLYGTFYIPPNSNAQVCEDIEQSIDLALTCNIDIIVTGDFNVNMLRNTSNDKISSLKNLFSLH